MEHRLASAGNRLEAALNRYLGFSLPLNHTHDAEGTNPPTQTLRNMERIPELDLIEQKIQRAKGIVAAARNCSATIVPIHRLSHSLLTRIFAHFVASEVCFLGVDHKGQLPKRSIYLTHVCTRWRQIAITSPDLWAHIDLSPSILKSEIMLSRTQAFLSRSGQSFLDIHVEYTGEGGSDHSSDLNNFIVPLVPRVRGVTCSIQISWLVSEFRFCQSSLSCFLNQNTTPGRLTRLDISVKGTSSTYFLQPAEQKLNSDSLSLNMTAQRLEELLLPITVLRVNTIYPQWTSKAFHGLRELRLRTPDRHTPIHESELVTVLAHNPQLRVFELGIPVEPADTPLAPLTLHNMEVLITHTPSYSQLGRILRLLDTGSSPLFVSIDSPRVDSELDDNMVHFFSHSNITRLCTERFSKFSEVFKLVNLAHTIKKLAMSPPPLDFGWEEELGLPIQFHLDTLYFLGNMGLDINQLRGMIEWSGIQKLVVWGDVYRATSADDGRPIVSKQYLKQELSRVLGVTVDYFPNNLPSPMDSLLL